MSRTYEIDITPARLRRSLSGLGADRPPNVPQSLSPETSIADFVVHWKNKSFEARGSYVQDRKVPRINILVATELAKNVRAMSTVIGHGASNISNPWFAGWAKWKREFAAWEAAMVTVFSPWDGKTVKGVGPEFDLAYDQARKFWDATSRYAIQANGYTSAILASDNADILAILLESAKNAPAVIANAITKASGATIRFGTELATGATKAVVGGFIGGLVAGLGPTLSVLLAAGGGFLAYRAIKGQPLPESVSRAGRWARDKVRRKKPLDGYGSPYMVLLMRGGGKRRDLKTVHESFDDADQHAKYLARAHDGASIEYSARLRKFYVMADQYYLNRDFDLRRHQGVSKRR